MNREKIKTLVVFSLSWFTSKTLCQTKLIMLHKEESLVNARLCRKNLRQGFYLGAFPYQLHESYNTHFNRDLIVLTGETCAFKV